MSDIAAAWFEIYIDVIISIIIISWILYIFKMIFSVFKKLPTWKQYKIQRQRRKARESQRLAQ